ncbi:MAG: winged helix-turn-helix transcriptional regulator [Streptomyces sp.]|nr:winged helix-turn-helix transcriptional regulator [Streptomyces sp.]NUS15420.1 winged helix-turn-helix transcriptional regulator [Streptomyces sp.]NUS24122.1 winged helix-turn-helix transcriptional regulator [Streptomyces sp.]
MSAYETEQSKYRRLARHLRTQIEAGTYAEGDMLPSEPQLAREHGMSRPTVVRALDLLRRDGLVVSEQGRGTFVRATAPDPGPAAVVEMERLRAWLTARHPDRMTPEASPVDVAISLLEQGRA